MVEFCNECGSDNKVFNFNHTAFYCCLTKSDYCIEFYMFVESTCQTFLNYWVAIWIWYASYNFEAPFLQGKKNLIKFVIKYWTLEIYICGKIIIYFYDPTEFYNDCWGCGEIQGKWKTETVFLKASW